MKWVGRDVQVADPILILACWDCSILVASARAEGGVGGREDQTRLDKGSLWVVVGKERC